MGKPWSKLHKKAVESTGDTWKTIVKSPKQTQGKLKINITFGQSTEIYELQSSPET